MKRKGQENGAGRDLRSRAEERVAAEGRHAPCFAEQDPLALVHELQVHQIELEMQNAELRRALDEVAALENYSDLYDFAPVGYFTLDRNGVIRAANLTGSSLMGVERSRLIGRRFGQFVADGDRPAFASFLDTTLRSQEIKRCETALLTEGNLPLIVQIEAVAAASGEECRLALIDLTERKEAENALRMTEERLSLALAASKMGVWDWNVQTNALSWSPETFKIHGVENFSGTLASFTNILHPDDADRVIAAASQALAEKTDYSMEYRIIRDGQVRWLSDLARPIYDEKGNPLRLIGTVHDITERKMTEEKIERSEHLLAEAQRIAHLGSWQWDSLSGKLIGSDEVFRIFGRVFSSIDDFMELVHPDDREWVSETIQKNIERPSPFNFSYRIILPDGTGRVVHAMGESGISDDGSHVRTFGTIQDITKGRALEDELGILHSKLIARAAELEAANVELDAFNHSVSHDLRRPLTVINSYCQVIQELCGGKLDDQCNGYIQGIYEGTLHMSQLIETMLTFSSVTRADLRLVRVDLSKMAEEVAIGLKLSEPRNQVTFRIAKGIMADGDAGLLRLVLDNLIGNAWKFTGKQEEPIIEFGVTVVDGKQACYVRDNGPGFDMADADKLFIPFQRLARTDVEGHGIGLATVERIVRRHGGRVWAESKPGNGATFYFTLPGGFGYDAGRQP